MKKKRLLVPAAVVAGVLALGAATYTVMGLDRHPAAGTRDSVSEPVPTSPPSPAPVTEPRLMSWQELPQDQKTQVETAFQALERAFDAGNMARAGALYKRFAVAETAGCHWLVLGKTFNPTVAGAETVIRHILTNGILDNYTPNTRVMWGSADLRPLVAWEYTGKPGTLDPSTIKPRLTPQAVVYAVVIACLAEPESPTIPKPPIPADPVADADA